MSERTKQLYKACESLYIADNTQYSTDITVILQSLLTALYESIADDIRENNRRINGYK